MASNTAITSTPEELNLLDGSAANTVVNSKAVVYGSGGQLAGVLSTAAQTGITSILAADLKIGEDDETKIDFETVNEIHFYANNTEQVYLADNIFGPQSDSDVDLGADGVRWKDAFIDKITTTGDIELGHASDTTVARSGAGQITVEGVAVLLAGAQTGITTDFNAGRKVGRDAHNLIDFSTDDKVTFRVANVDEITLEANEISPTTNDGIALGSAAKGWSDLFLADGGTIQFGDDQDIKLTHVHDEGLILEAAATNTPILEIKNTHNGGTAGILKFNNTEAGTDGADNDKLGSVEFHGNDDGTPSVQQYAGIIAEIHDATSTEESGKLTFQVASHDGGVESGLILTGGSVDAEVDVTIGNGSASLTSVAGDLLVAGGDLNGPSGGGFNIAPSLSDGQSLKLGVNGAVEVVITPHGTPANEIYSVTNTAGTAATAVAMTSTAGGISLTAETTHGVTISTSTPDAAGAGVSSAVGVTTTISKVNGVIETVILVDFSGLTTQSSNLRIIGDGSGTAELTKITHEKNGYIYRAEIGCIETPAGGATVCTDIDLVADTTARAGGYDLGGASSDLIVVNAGGSWVIGKWEPSNVAPAGGASLTDGLDDYFLMLASGADAGGASGTYNAGKFVIKLYGASF